MKWFGRMFLFYVNAFYVAEKSLLLFLFYSTKNQHNTILQWK